jgi:hypothetical protein
MIMAVNDTAQLDTSQASLLLSFRADSWFAFLVKSSQIALQLSHLSCIFLAAQSMTLFLLILGTRVWNHTEHGYEMYALRWLPKTLSPSVKRPEHELAIRLHLLARLMCGALPSLLRPLHGMVRNSRKLSYPSPGVLHVPLILHDWIVLTVLY